MHAFALAANVPVAIVSVAIVGLPCHAIHSLIVRSVATVPSLGRSRCPSFKTRNYSPYNSSDHMPRDKQPLNHTTTGNSSATLPMHPRGSAA